MPRPIKYNKTAFLTDVTALFIADGIAGTSIGDIVEATGMNRHSIYRNFDDKEGVYAACLAHYRDEMFAPMYALLARRDGETTLRKCFDTLLDPGEPVGCLMVQTVTDRHHVPSEIFDVAKSHFKRIRKEFRANLKLANVDLETAELEMRTDILLGFFHGLPASTATGKTTNIKKAANALITNLVR